MTTTHTSVHTITSTSASPRTVAAVDISPVLDILQKVHSLQKEMDTVVIEREEAVLAVLLALLSRQHVFLFGTFGIAKSFLVSQIVKRFSGLRYFKKLMSSETRLEHLFGMPSLKEYKQNDILRYATPGMAHDAEIVFLDEFFKAEYLVGTLLSLMEEREFENPLAAPVPLESLFAASNEIPRPDTPQGLAAWDRFTLRVHLEPVSEPGFLSMMQLGRVPQPQVLLQKSELQLLQDYVPQIPIPASILQTLTQLHRDLKRQGIEISDRRWMHSRRVLQAHALIFNRGMVEEDDLAIYQWMWDDPSQLTDLRRICAVAANPLKAEAVRLGDQATGSYSEAMKAQDDAQLSEEQRGTIAYDSARKLKSIERRLRHLYEQAAQEGRNATGIHPIEQDVHRKCMHLNAIALGEAPVQGA